MQDPATFLCGMCQKKRKDYAFWAWIKGGVVPLGPKTVRAPTG